MKKTGITIFALTGILIILAAFNTAPDTTFSDPPKNIPDSVWAVVEKSCYDCHSSDGNGMAKAKINFDKWDDYSSDKQVSKAQDICTELQKGKMPPSKHRKNNPETIPTDVEVARICTWVQQIGK